MENGNSKHDWFRLTYGNTKKLMAYFITLILIGLSVSLLIVTEWFQLLNGWSILNKAIIGSMSMSLLGSSIFYGRKLYKAAINLDMILPINNSDNFRQLGIIYYFILRPLFSVCFAVLTVLIVKSGIYFVSDSNGIKENFIFGLMVISFFIGYSSGDFIDVLEENGKKVVKTIMRQNEND